MKAVDNGVLGPNSFEGSRKFYKAAVNRLFSMMEQYSSLKDEDYPKELVFFDFPRHTVHSRQELLTKIVESCELLGLDVLLRFSDEDDGTVVTHKISPFLKKEGHYHDDKHVVKQ